VTSVAPAVPLLPPRMLFLRPQNSMIGRNKQMIIGLNLLTDSTTGCNPFERCDA